MDTFKMNKKLLWLDDIRDPFANNIWIEKYAPEFLNDGEIIWVKSFDEFEKWIHENGLPDKISFDHDLADEHYTPEHRYDDYHDWAKEQNFKEKTGMDCAQFIVDYCLDYKKLMPMWAVHSANPNGAENINKLLLNFLKHQNKHF
jgi:hypothetical protein